VAKLNEMIKEFRISIDQSTEALALLMQVNQEDYARLEEDWIPPADILQRLCTLFEWNYQEISRLALNTPQARQAPAVEGGRARATFGEQLQTERLAVGQTLEGLATLLGIPVDYYQALEESVIPSDELLRKICAMFEWNYRQVRQRLITSTTPNFGGYQPPLSARDIRTRFPETLETPEWNATPTESRFSLGERLREAREDFGQPAEALALLLQITPELYEEIEQNLTRPSQELIRQICALFEWNYNEVVHQFRHQNRQLWQPAITHLNNLEPHQVQKLQGLQDEITSGWKELTKEQRDTLLSQLELVRDTIDRWKLKNTL
jgi:transcriptional regulator with XRE-family HTH domain